MKKQLIQPPYSSTHVKEILPVNLRSARSLDSNRRATLKHLPQTSNLLKSPRIRMKSSARTFKFRPNYRTKETCLVELHNRITTTVSTKLFRLIEAVKKQYPTAKFLQDYCTSNNEVYRYLYPPDSIDPYDRPETIPNKRFYIISSKQKLVVDPQCTYCDFENGILLPNACKYPKEVDSLQNSLSVPNSRTGPVHTARRQECSILQLALPLYITEPHSHLSPNMTSREKVKISLGNVPRLSTPFLSTTRMRPEKRVATSMRDYKLVKFHCNASNQESERISIQYGLTFEEYLTLRKDYSSLVKTGKTDKASISEYYGIPVVAWNGILPKDNKMITWPQMVEFYTILVLERGDSNILFQYFLNYLGIDCPADIKYSRLAQLFSEILTTRSSGKCIQIWQRVCDSAPSTGALSSLELRYLVSNFIKEL